MSFNRSCPLPALLALALATLAGGMAGAADPAAITFVEAGRVEGATPELTVTAVGLRAAPTKPLEAARIVVLVDTSASQTGAFRRRQREAVDGLVANLRPADRLLVVACDVSCNRLMDGFAAADSESCRKALRSLDNRTPLGATDLPTVLEEAASFFDDDEAARAIVYVGDGPGFAGVEAEAFAAALDRVRSQRIAVCGVGIGPQVNWPCLAAVSAATGGMLIVPAAEESAADAGKRMAALAVQPIAWPENGSYETAGGDARLLPGRLPALRADRDSIVLVAGPAAGSLRFSLKPSAGDAAEVKLRVPAAEPNEEHAYLGVLARNAWDTEGLFLPLLGREGMTVARRVIRGEAEALAGLSRQAEAAGAHDQAARLAEASLRRDPSNQAADVIRVAALKRLAEPDELPAPEATKEDVEAGDDELADLEALRKVRGQRLEQETAVRIRAARQMLATDPDQARERLKEAQALVRDSDDLDAADRDRLLRDLDLRIRESTIRSREKLDRDLSAERKAAIGRERARLTSELERREDRIKQLVERYNALVEQGIRDGFAQSERYPQIVQGDKATGYEAATMAITEAERIVGDEIAREAPPLWANQPIPMTARVIGKTAGLVARTLDYYAENERVRRDQERGFMDTLHLVDVAGIPYPDEPSIIYPNKARWAALNAARQKYSSAAFTPLSEREKEIYDKLEAPTGARFSFDNSSLRDFATAIESMFGIPVQFDTAALAADSVDIEAAGISRPSRNTSLRSALRSTLSGLEVPLTYMVKDETLVITTKTAAEKDLVPRVYAVGDLVLPVDPLNAVNPFNLGGTTNQDQNQVPAGQNNPLGAGVCWVAREVYGVHDPRWLVFRGWLLGEAPAWLRDLYVAQGETFADWIHDRPFVKTVVRGLMDLVVVPHTMGQLAAGGQFQVAEARARLARREKPDIDLAPPASEDAVEDRVGLPDTVLDADDLTAAVAAYLPLPDPTARTSGPDAREIALRLARLRVSAADLGRAGQFDRAAALISAAIACGRAEPWMYESLALALEAAGRPRADIERVLLSSADMAVSPVDLLALANYLARFGSEKQAIRICRQVTRLDPVNREAYALAMTIAARSDDVATLQWACPGVLAHDWPATQQEVAVRARRLAEATIERLAKDGSEKESKAFRQLVDEARARDLVIDIAWGGDADVDMVVEEPTGSVCSRESPRSTAGGALLADDQCPIEPGSHLHRERYAATLAFPGTYRVLVRRVAGKVTADTITVEMTRFKGGKGEETIRRQVPVTADAQILAIELPDGRRRVPIEEARIANDVAEQQAVGKAVLAQQLASLSDPGTAAELAKSRSDGPSGRQATVGSLFGRPNATGYQPRITTLPEGVNAQFRAVVSHDRRYVRVTTSPMFSGIGNVTTFSFSGGGQQGGMGQGGMGGGGMGGMGGGMGGMGGGMGGMGGGMGQGMGQGQGMGPPMCWVARAVYGPENPRWLLFREWMLCDAPLWLVDVYARHGEAFAGWIHDKPAVKAALRFAMDHVIEHRVSPPCPASE